MEAKELKNMEAKELKNRIISSKTMEKKRYAVECTLIYNGYIEVESETINDAIEYVQERLNGDFGNDFPNKGKFGIVNFLFGLATADYVREI